MKEGEREGVRESGRETEPIGEKTKISPLFSI
jgi:hypothetical protein